MLDDQVNVATSCAILTRMSDKEFSLCALNTTGEAFVSRLRAYEEAVRPLQVRAALLGKWAMAEQLPTLTNTLVRMWRHWRGQRRNLAVVVSAVLPSIAAAVLTRHSVPRHQSIVPLQPPTQNESKPRRDAGRKVRCLLSCPWLTRCWR